jgi:hypothetical protein
MQLLIRFALAFACLRTRPVLATASSKQLDHTIMLRDMFVIAPLGNTLGAQQKQHRQYQHKSEFKCQYGCKLGARPHNMHPAAAFLDREQERAV